MSECSSKDEPLRNREDRLVIDTSPKANVMNAEEAMMALGFLEEETLPLIQELCEDLQRFYEPEKGWPPHIERAMDLGDEKQTLVDLRAFVGQST